MTKKKIPRHWKWVVLNDIGIITSGGTPSTKEPSFWNGDIPWITPADLSGHENVFVARGSRCISKVGLDNSSAHLLPENSIVFSSRAPIGYVAITKDKLATNQGFKNLILPSKSVDAKYVYYYLRTVKELAENLASGTTFLELSTTKFAQIPIPLAPIEDQLKIVEKLEELLSQIEYAKLQLNDAMVKLEYKFLKTLTVRLSKHGGSQYKLAQLAEWGSGGTPSRTNPAYFNGTIPWVKTQELKTKYITETQEYLTSEGLKNSSAKIYPAGSLVIAMYGATAGQLAILKIDASTNQACAVGVVKNPNTVNIEYLYYSIMANKHNLVERAKGGAQRNISLSVIKDFLIDLPSIENQLSLVNEINLLNAEILNQKKIIAEELRRAEALSQKILREAFSGTLLFDNIRDYPSKLTKVDIKNIIAENEKYRSTKFEERRTKKRVKTEKIKLIDILMSNYRNKAFQFEDIVEISSMSMNSLEEEFRSLLKKGEVTKIYDEESKSIKFKIT